MPLKRRLFLWHFLCPVMLLLCVGASAVPASGSVDRALRVSIGMTDIKTLDPGLVTTTQDMFLADMLFNGLLRFKPGDVSVLEPDLAESYALSPDGMLLTFKLRKGVRSHPFKGHPKGVEITSDDVLFTLAKNTDPKKSTTAATFQNFVASAPDPYTVEIRLKRRVPTPERAFANFRTGCIIPRKAYETLGERRFKTRPIGTGPFMLSEYQPGQKIVLAANTAYFRGKPKLDRVEVLFMPEINSREFALSSGAVDIIDGSKEQLWVDKMKKAKGVVVDVFGPGELAFFNFNVAKELVSDLRVRQALSLATDIDSLRAFKGRDIAEGICGIVAPMMPGGLTCEEAREAGVAHVYDPGKAKALLKEAGFPDGFDMTIVSSERAPFRQILENVQAQWKKIGVNMLIDVVDHSTFHTRIRQNTSPVVYYISQRPDANEWLTQFFHSDAIVVKGKAPITNFSNCDTLDGLIEQARVEVDAAKQQALWKEAQVQILKNLYALPLYLQLQVWAHSDKVDYGFPLKSSYTTAPNITELTAKK